MPTNLYFNNYSFTGEQLLIEDLIIEAIKVYGVECYYLPRTMVNEDEVWGEDASSKFESAYPLEMYIKNVDAFEGEGDFLSKFGLEIRDAVTLTISQRRFGEEIDIEDTTKDVGRPAEGDLIWFPLNGKIFEVKHVEHEAIFYQLGSLQTYDLRCELFEYSTEIIDTGVKVIDDIATQYSIDELIFQILFETNTDTAFAITNITNGRVSDVIITHEGSNFTSPPTVTFESPQGDPQRANTVASVSSGRISEVSVIDGGGYYTFEPDISFAAPEGESSPAQGLAQLENNSLQSITVTDPGFFYHESPTVSISQPNGTNVLGGQLNDGNGIMGAKSLFYPSSLNSFTIEGLNNSDSMTLDFFYKPDTDTQSGSIFNSESFNISLNNGQIELNNVLSQTQILSDQWSYIVLNSNSDFYTLYVNGNEEIQFPKATDISNTFLTFGNATGNSAIGYYDAVRIRNGQIMNIATPTTVATNAEATVTVSQGIVDGITITNEGGYYTETPDVTIDPPTNFSYVATAEPTVTNLSVSSVEVTNGGFYYTEPPTVEFAKSPIYSTDFSNYGNSSLHLANSSTLFEISSLTANNNGTLNFHIFADKFNTLGGDIVTTDDWKFVKIVDESDPNSIRNEYQLLYPNNSVIVSNRNWDLFVDDIVTEFNYVSIQVRESLGNKILKVRIGNYTNTISSATSSLPSDFKLFDSTITFQGLANTYIDGVIISDYSSDALQADPLNIPSIGTYAPWGGAEIFYVEDFEDYRIAQGTAVVQNGEVISINITNGGYGYQELPSITISSPNTAQYYSANAIATIANGHVVDVSISNSGIGYYTVPNVSFDPALVNEFDSRTTYHANNTLFAEDFEYKNASAVSNIDANGFVTSIDVIDGGFGFELPPTVSFSEPDTDQYYTATANTSVADGKVVSVSVTNSGFGYTQSNVYPLVALPIYNTAEGTANVNANGIVTAVTITDPGSGYTLAPKIFIVGDPVSGALQSEDEAFFLQEEANTNSSSVDGYDSSEYFQTQVEIRDATTDIGFIDFSEKNPFSEGGEW